MIFEYALEPELVATWSNRSDYRYFMDKFGIGTARVVSKFPENWVNQVQEHAKPQKALDGTRMVELLKRLQSAMVSRSAGAWNESKTWLGNAIDEHDRRNFYAILARSKPQGNAPILSREDLEEGFSEKEDRKRIPRTKEAICAEASPLLSISKKIHLIDKHFRVNDPRHRWMGPMAGFISAAFDNRPNDQVRLEIHCCGSDENPKRPSPQEFKNECIQGLSRLIPKGRSLQVKTWKRKPGGDDMHDRFILTNIGGIQFSVGLDTGDSGTTTEVHIISRKEYDLLWGQYTSLSPEFDKAEEPIHVEGKR
jgi:hypothetical protein